MKCFLYRQDLNSSNMLYYKNHKIIKKNSNNKATDTGIDFKKDRQLSALN